MVERHPSKLDVTGSNPVFRSSSNSSVVECLLYTEGVGGSNPSSSIPLGDIGRVVEWLMASVLKTDEGASPP